MHNISQFLWRTWNYANAPRVPLRGDICRQFVDTAQMSNAALKSAGHEKCCSCRHIESSRNAL
eukprot:292791-Chlamydomonas_euryale.AAC.5